MQVKDQIISLELAKMLKDLGVLQKSLWYWYRYYYDKQWFIGHKEEIAFEENPDCYSAFTVAEIGEMLPIALDFIDDENSPYSGHRRLIEWKGVDGWWVGYIPTNCEFEDFKAVQITGKDWRIKCWAETEADAKAKMLIWLIEKEIIKV